MDAVYDRHGPARVRRTGRESRQRWFVIAPLEHGELLTCVFRAALPRDLKPPHFVAVEWKESLFRPRPWGGGYTGSQRYGSITDNAAPCPRSANAVDNRQAVR